jgi:hypothetical protein
MQRGPVRPGFPERVAGRAAKSTRVGPNRGGALHASRQHIGNLASRRHRQVGPEKQDNVGRG